LPGAVWPERREQRAVGKLVREGPAEQAGRSGRPRICRVHGPSELH
jgi:hypothetical protein